jgi:hypothetical protein
MKELRWMVVLGAALASIGCIGFSKHGGSELPGWPPPAGPKILGVNVVAVIDPRAEGTDLANNMLGENTEAMRMGVVRAFSGCPGFNPVEAPSQAWDRRVVVNFKTLEEQIGFKRFTVIMSGLTILTLPVIEKYRLQLTATIYDSDGRNLGTYFQEGGVGIWASLLFLPAWPFSGISAGCESETYELTRRLILEAKRAGAL